MIIKFQIKVGRNFHRINDDKINQLKLGKDTYLRVN